MKKLTFSVLALAVVATSFTSCKRGDEDPGLSLRSRTSRFAGEWKMDTEETSYTDSYTSTSGGFTTTDEDVVKETYSGGTATMDENSKTTSNTSSGTIITTSSDKSTGTVTENTITIEKDGTYKRVKKVKWTSNTHTDASGTDIDVLDITETTEEEGTWQFLGKNKSEELKNKESVVFSAKSQKKTTIEVETFAGVTGTSTLTTTTTFANNQNTEVWHITRLANKEITVDMEMDYSYNGTSQYSEPGISVSNTMGPHTIKGTGSAKMSQ